MLGIVVSPCKVVSVGAEAEVVVEAGGVKVGGRGGLGGGRQE